jgi:hypothetical protein
MIPRRSLYSELASGAGLLEREVGGLFAYHGSDDHFQLSQKVQGSSLGATPATVDEVAASAFPPWGVDL